MAEIARGLLGLDPLGATPLEEDDLEDLRPKHITTRRDLYDAEFKNITNAYSKYLTSKRAFVFSLSNFYKLHREMFGFVWNWSGKKRKTNKNIGIDKIYIDVELKKLIDDFQAWETNQHDPVEISARLHAKLVAIHPFNNGNGRWARLICNLYLKNKTGRYIDWPEDQLFITTDFRKKYINTLQEADKHNLKPLIDLHKKYLNK